MTARREFAANTDVPVSRTRGEIEEVIMRNGGDRFGSFVDRTSAAILFEIAGRRIRIVIPLPDMDSPDFEPRYKGGGRYGPADEQRRVKWEQACRTRWRALLLVLKAKLEAVAVGIASLEDELLAYTILPPDENNETRTVGEAFAEPIREAYATGTFPALVPGLPNRVALAGGRD